MKTQEYFQRRKMMKFYRPKCRLNPMRLLLFVLTLPLGASPIINSTSVQTTCVWIGPLPVQPDITLNASSGSGSSSESCPVNYGGPSTSASSTVSGADATATAQMSGIGIGNGEPQANAGFDVSGLAQQSGSLPLEFVTSWRLQTDDSFAQISVTFYFNGVPIGGFTKNQSGAGDTFLQESISNFVEPVVASEAYTFSAEAVAEVGPDFNSAFSTVEVQDAIPEPDTIFLVGFVCLGFCLLRARAITGTKDDR
jgi:hypothetical protein